MSIKTVPKARVLFFTKGTDVCCKVNLVNNYGLKYQIGTGHSIKVNNMEDQTKYPLIVGFNVIDSFLEANDIKDKEVEIDPNGLDMFYGYTSSNGVTRYSIKPSKRFIDGWWHRDCPDFFRYKVNKNGPTNHGIYFKNSLVQVWNGVHIDKEITEEEALMLIQGREHTAVSKEIMAVVNSRKMSEEQIERIQKWLQDYEAKIQKAINNNNLIIVLHINDMFDSITGCERHYGLDCGILSIFSDNPEYNEKKMLIKNLPNSQIRNQQLDVKMPYNSQSLTVMKKQFEKVKEVVFAATGETLYCKTILD